MVSAFFHRIAALLFGGPTRLVELYSALNLLAWSRVLVQRPDLLLRDSYAGFTGLGALPWAGILAVIALAQIIPFLRVFRHGTNLRFAAMAAASGAWMVVAVNFISSGVSTTAEASYLLLSLICMASGAYLGWTSQNS